MFGNSPSLQLKMQTIKACLKNQQHLFTLGPNSGFCTESYLAMITVLGNSKHSSSLSCFCKTSLGLIKGLSLMDCRYIFFSRPTCLLLLFQILRNINRIQIRKDLWKLSTAELWKGFISMLNLSSMSTERRSYNSLPLPSAIWPCWIILSRLLPHKHQNLEPSCQVHERWLKAFHTYIYN